MREVRDHVFHPRESLCGIGRRARRGQGAGRDPPWAEVYGVFPRRVDGAATRFCSPNDTPVAGWWPCVHPDRRSSGSRSCIVAAPRRSDPHAHRQGRTGLRDRAGARAVRHTQFREGRRQPHSRGGCRANGIDPPDGATLSADTGIAGLRQHGRQAVLACAADAGSRLRLPVVAQHLGDRATRHAGRGRSAERILLDGRARRRRRPVYRTRGALAHDEPARESPDRGCRRTAPRSDACCFPGCRRPSCDAFFKRSVRRAYTRHTVTGETALRRIIAGVRQAGYALIDQEIEEGLRAIAVPIRCAHCCLEAREHFAALHARLARCDAHIAAYARHSSAVQRAGELLGAGPVTSSALAATVPDAKVFRSGRQFGAWLGLTPRQHSSGGKTRLGRISLRGNVYLRTLLIQGARSTLQAAINTEPARASRLQRWIIELYGRKGYYKTLIAIANKHARMLWAMLAKDERYDALAWQRHPLNQPPHPGDA